MDKLKKLKRQVNKALKANHFELQTVKYRGKTYQEIVIEIDMYNIFLEMIDSLIAEK